MKICIVTETYPPEINGVARTLRRIKKELESQRHKVTIVRPLQVNEEKDNSLKNTIIVPSLPLPKYKNLRVGIPSGRALKIAWTKKKPDIVYVATEGPLGQSAINAANKMNITVVSGFHTNFHEYMKYYNLSLLENAAKEFLQKTHAKTKAIFIPSKDVEKKLHEMNLTHTKILSRGVDTKHFSAKNKSKHLRKSFGIDIKKGIVVLFVSRIAAEKNIGLAVKAFKKIKKTYPDSVFVIVGDGPEKEKLERKYPEFIFTGMLHGKELAKHYASADIFLFPSTTETFGNVVIEAMASGLVTVAYDYAAAKQYITSGENGFLAKYTNEKDFINQALKAITYKASWKDIKYSARKTAIQLSWKRIVKKFVKDLKEIRKESKQRKK